jgi:hypothetical protein
VRLLASPTRSHRWLLFNAYRNTHSCLAGQLKYRYRGRSAPECNQPQWLGFAPRSAQLPRATGHCVEVKRSERMPNRVGIDRCIEFVDVRRLPRCARLHTPSRGQACSSSGLLAHLGERAGSPQKVGLPMFVSQRLESHHGQMTLLKHNRKRRGSQQTPTLLLLPRWAMKRRGILFQSMTAGC